MSHLSDVLFGGSTSHETVVRDNSLVHVAYVVAVGETVAEDVPSRWISMASGLQRLDAVWGQLVGKKEGSEFDLGLPPNKRLRVDLSKVPRSAGMAARVKGRIIQVVQPRFEAGKASMSNMEKEISQAESLYAQGKLVHARAVCEKAITFAYSQIGKELDLKNGFIIAMGQARSLLSCVALRQDSWGEALYLATVVHRQEQENELYAYRLAAIRFACRPQNSLAVREMLLRVKAPHLQHLKQKLEARIRQYAQKTVIVLDDGEVPVAETVLPPSPPRDAHAMDDLATAKTDDDEEDGGPEMAEAKRRSKRDLEEQELPEASGTQLSNTNTTYSYIWQSWNSNPKW